MYTGKMILGTPRLYAVVPLGMFAGFGYVACERMRDLILG